MIVELAESADGAPSAYPGGEGAERARCRPCGKIDRLYHAYHHDASWPVDMRCHCHHHCLSFCVMRLPACMSSAAGLFIGCGGSSPRRRRTESARPVHVAL